MRKFVARIGSVAALAGFVAVTGFASMGCTVKVGTKKEPAAPAPAAEPAPAAPAPKKPSTRFKGFKVSGDGKVELPGPVLFETNSDRLKPESDAVLQHVVNYLNATPKVTLLRVEGHTDSDGDDASNFILSQKRAMACVRWLVAKGIDCKRLIPVGFGESRLLINPEAGPQDKETNRRVQFINAELNGEGIAGFPKDGGGQIAGQACP